jgi:hypothetical protein
MRTKPYLAAGCLAVALLSACAEMPSAASPVDAKVSDPSPEPVREEAKSEEVVVTGSATTEDFGNRKLAFAMPESGGESMAESRPALAERPPPPPPAPPAAPRSYADVMSVAPGAMAEDSADRSLRASAQPGKQAPPRDAPAGPRPAHPGAPVANPQGSVPRADTGEAVAPRGPMLVYTAAVTMAVFEVNASLARVEAIGREVGGFLAKRDDRSITIRVPVARFDEAVKRIEGVGDMLHRNVSAEDVTEQFRDLEVRLKSARAVQERLTQLLAKAVKVEESVLIERELDRVTGEIERIEGKIKFLRDRASLSTITVTFDAKRKETAGSEVRLPGRWLQELGLRRLLGI